MLFKPKLCRGNNEYSLNGKAILNSIVPEISQRLSLMKNDIKNKSLIEMIISCLIRDQSVYSSSKLYQKFSSETAIWYQLNKCQVVDIDGCPCCTYRCSESSPQYYLDKVQRELLWECIKDYFDLSKKYVFAIDETMIPYYGTDKNTNPFVISGKTKKSTNSFFGYAAISIVFGYHKVTLSVLPLIKGLKRFEIVKQLIADVEEHGIKIDHLLMDRGYYIADIMQYLETKEIGYIIPVKMNSKYIKDYVSSLKKSASFTHHMMTSDKKGIDVTVVAVIKHVPKEAHRDRKKYGKWRANVYVCSGIPMNYNKIYNEYRHRFAIEADFRIMNKSLVKTSSRNPAIRYLFTFLCFCFQNMWRVLRVRFFTKKQRGPKVVDDDKFRYNSFMDLLCRAINKRLKNRDTITLT